MEKPTGRFDIAQEYLKQGMSMEDAATKAGYKNAHALSIAIGRRAKAQAPSTNATEPDRFCDTTKTIVEQETPRQEPERSYEYVAQYKCRMCGGMHLYSRWGSQKLAFAHTLHVAITGNPYPQPLAPSLMMAHECPDGSIGVADFIGAAKVPAE